MIDVLARPGWLVVRVVLPGVPAETIHLDVCEGALIVWGEDRPGRCASFSRAIDLPPGAWPDRIRAALVGGVLDIRVPVCPHDETMAPPSPRSLELSSPTATQA